MLVSEQVMSQTHNTPSMITLLISSPELPGSQGQLIGYLCSGAFPSIVRPPFSRIFSETAWPIKAKFHVGPPWEGGTKVDINGPGHITKIAGTPIMVKPFKKSSQEFL